MTDALFAFGTVLKMGDGETEETFTAIAEVVSISGPSFSLDTEDVTSHDSTGGWEEMIATVLRSGEVTLDLNYVPTADTHDADTGLLAAKLARRLVNWQLIFPDALLEVDRTTWEFAGYVTAFEPSAPHDGKLAASVTIKPTGVMTLA
jgi:predicted secreted protein